MFKLGDILKGRERRRVEMVCNLYCYDEKYAECLQEIESYCKENLIDRRSGRLSMNFCLFGAVSCVHLEDYSAASEFVARALTSIYPSSRRNNDIIYIKLYCRYILNDIRYHNPELDIEQLFEYTDVFLEDINRVDPKIRRIFPLPEEECFDDA